MIDPFVASPNWHHYIVVYFFLGGLAAGAYAVYCLAILFGDEDLVSSSKPAAYLAFPLVGVCGIVLIVDLNRPERFWHMLIQSQTFRPMLKWWSPMSAGSWGLSAFSAFSALSFLAVLAENHRLGLRRWSPLARRLRSGWLGRSLATGGLLSALFLGSYTGTLLSATNQPIWAQTAWLSPLFLASSFSTGLAAILLGGAVRKGVVEHSAKARLEWFDGYALLVELAMLLALAYSLGPLSFRAFARWPGVLIPAFVVPVGLIVPFTGRWIAGRWVMIATTTAALLGGYALRFAVVGLPETFLIHP